MKTIKIEGEFTYDDELFPEEDNDWFYNEILLKENLELQKTVAIKQEMYPLKLCRIDTPKKGESESVAFALASDWHLEQEVRRDEIIYNNQYNLEIAEARAKEFFTNTLDLIRRQQEDQVIKTLVLWLGGDFITSNIHTELLKICKLGPAQAICFARDLLISGINFILENSELNLIIPFNFGNHSRIVEKNWSSNEEDNSLEYILYDDITLHFKNNPRVVMVPPTGGTATIEVYGMKIGFVHGHREFKFKGGVGGLYVPVRSKIKDKFSPIGYDLIILGHFHSFIQDTLFLCNGSMIGYDQYANCKGFRAESPKQTFFVISSKWKCRTATYPILFSK